MSNSDRYGPFFVGELVTETGWYYGIIIKSGPKMYEVLWENGDHSRHRQDYMCIYHQDISRLHPYEAEWAEKCLERLRADAAKWGRSRTPTRPP